MNDLKDYLNVTIKSLSFSSFQLKCHKTHLITIMLTYLSKFYISFSLLLKIFSTCLFSVDVAEHQTSLLFQFKREKNENSYKILRTCQKSFSLEFSVITFKVFSKVKNEVLNILVATPFVCSLNYKSQICLALIKYSHKRNYHKTLTDKEHALSILIFQSMLNYIKKVCYEHAH